MEEFEVDADLESDSSQSDRYVHNYSCFFSCFVFGLFFPFLTVPIPSENFLLSDTKVMLRFFSVKKIVLMAEMTLTSFAMGTFPERIIQCPLLKKIRDKAV